MTSHDYYNLGVDTQREASQVSRNIQEAEGTVIQAYKKEGKTYQQTQKQRIRTEKNCIWSLRDSIPILWQVILQLFISKGLNEKRKEEIQPQITADMPAVLRQAAIGLKLRGRPPPSR